jgi:hypothetical protein
MLLRKFLLLFILLLTVVSCEKESEFPEDIQINDFVWKGLNAYYLDQPQIENLADTRFSNDRQLEGFLRGFETPEDIFSSLIIGTDTLTTLLPDFNEIDDPMPRRVRTAGMEFGIIEDPNSIDRVIGYVQLILPNSFASTQPIARGDFFSEVNGEPLTRENFLNLLISPTSPDDFTLTMVDFDGVTVVPNGNFVFLSKQVYDYPPVYAEKVFDVNGSRVGYVAYHNDFSTFYLSDLNNAFGNLRGQNIDDLVIDLRYSIGKGSFARNVAEIASMITGQFPGEVLIKEEWNTKAQSWFSANQPDSLITRFPTNLRTGETINGLQLNRVFIIPNTYGYESSSAIELLINSLNPYIEVNVIGRPTNGFNKGLITLYDSPDYDFEQKNELHTYALQPQVLRFYNSLDATYEMGLPVTVEICALEDYFNLGEYGELSDPLLNRVMEFVTTGNIGTNPICSPFDLDYLFNSTSGIGLEKGVFINQDLPNL